jgi:hypothetical protein
LGVIVTSRQHAGGGGWLQGDVAREPPPRPGDLIIFPGRTVLCLESSGSLPAELVIEAQNAPHGNAGAMPINRQRCLDYLWGAALVLIRVWPDTFRPRLCALSTVRGYIAGRARHAVAPRQKISLQFAHSRRAVSRGRGTEASRKLGFCIANDANTDGKTQWPRRRSPI